MNHKLFIMLDWIILIAVLGSTLGTVDRTHADWPSTNPAAVTPKSIASQPVNVPIDPNILQSLEQEGTAWVQIIFEQQADLGGASRLGTKAEKGAFVYRQLTTIAAQTQAPLRAYLDARKIEYKAYWIINMLLVKVDDGLLDELRQQPGIERITGYTPPADELPLGQELSLYNRAEFGPFLQSQPSIPAAGNQVEPAAESDLSRPAAVKWNIQRVGADEVWALGFTGQGVVVGSLDSGVEYTHEALINQYRGNLGGDNFDHNYNWYDGAGGSPIPVDYGWHGTYTMGPILGEDSSHINQIGVAPGAKWIACPGFGSPNINPIDCYQWFLAPTDLDGNNPLPDLAPNIINQTSFSAADYQSAIQALVAAGIYIATPAGNDGSECRTIELPMNQWTELTSVGAFNQMDQITEWSSRGPVMVRHETLIKPDITAPGVNVRTSIPGNQYYDPGWGTSIAAPHVSGAAALLISAVPQLRGRVDLIDMLLKKNAEPKATYECTPAGGVPNNVWGWGILNAYNAVLAAQALEIGAIEGQVVEAENQNPISGVQLSFTEASMLWPYQETTTDLGKYGHILPAGTYNISARHYGYLDTLVSGVEISPGVTTSLDIEMSAAPVWTVSGVITDLLTVEPLAATIALENTTVATETDPETGEFTAQAAQGEWWLVVSSPGYAEAAVKINLDQDLVQNFSLDPVANYYMRRSVDGECGAQFEWLDATGGTPVPGIDWITPQDVALPFSKSFTFYGTTYTEISINAHGIVTFGSEFAYISGPIPNTNLPNNGIYAFSNALNPGTSWGGGGAVFTKMIDDRYFVIEWYQVPHWVNRDPETFEIILDLDTNQVKFQYLTINDPTGVVAGVENSTGTVATQYAYGDPELIANNAAVEFYPWFSAPPPTGGLGEISGTVTDGITAQPIEGALVTAAASTRGEIFTYTTDITGTYSASLCADLYQVEAGAPYYAPGDASAPVYPGEQTVVDFDLTPLNTPPSAVALTGLISGWVSTPYTFTAVVEPISTTLPLEYVWEADGQATITQTAGLSDTISYIWETPGTYAISVTANNIAGSVSTTQNITIATPIIETYLPLVIKSSDIPKSPSILIHDYRMPFGTGMVWLFGIIYSFHRTSNRLRG